MPEVLCVNSNAASSKRPHVEPLDFIALARRVLHLANKGTARIEFLREASRMILGFSGCDALELYVAHSRINYWWSARVRPRESFDFRLGGAKVDSAAQGQAPSWLDELAGRVQQGNVGPRSRCITQRGSFWTADAESDLALNESPENLSDPRQYAIGSLAVVPFEVGENAPCALVLSSGRKHLFTEQNIEFYEALAQTLGLAMDDRRAQHALNERVKELTCLYAIAQVFEVADGTLAECLEQVVTTLPAAWQFPESVVARIRVDNVESNTGDFERTIHRQRAAVVVNGRERGAVEVGYVTDEPEFAETVFLEEEAHLIEAVAREVSAFMERREAHEEKERLADQVRHADRLMTIGQLASGIAHDINEPLGSILGFSQLLRKQVGLPDPILADLDKIIHAALQAREIVRKLMLFARQSVPAWSWARLNDIVEGCLNLLATRFMQRNINVVKKLDPAIPHIYADPVQIHQLVVNLCVNGVQAMADGGTLTVRTQADKESVLLMVEDTGTGMPSEVADRVFEPFFTTKSAEEGTGLGLSVVHDIVTAHSGTIQFKTQAGVGTRFEVHFPLNPTSARPLNEPLS
jgi:signal transduction histidine kinase